MHRTEAGKAGERVAVKIQYPNAEQVMQHDVVNLRRACMILERTDLKFDLSSMCRELAKQLAMEFDFRIVRGQAGLGGSTQDSELSISFISLTLALGRRLCTHPQEAESLRKVGAPLERALPFIAVPKPYLATRRVLVMSFLDGVSISRLEESEARRRAGSKRRRATRILTLGLAGRGPKEGEEPPPLGVIGEGLKRRLGLDLIRKMADAWGYMMFNCDAVHCDNHPGAWRARPGCMWQRKGTWPPRSQVHIATPHPSRQHPPDEGHEAGHPGLGPDQVPGAQAQAAARAVRHESMVFGFVYSTCHSHPSFFAHAQSLRGHGQGSAGSHQARVLQTRHRHREGEPELFI